MPASLTRRVLLTLLFSTAAMCVASAADRVRFLRPPRVISDRYGLRWAVQVDQHPDHRLLVLTALEGEFAVRRTDIGLEGERAPRTHWVTWGPLPAGELLILATVWDGAREVARAVHPLTVVSMLG